VRRFAEELVRDELVHNVASDAHDTRGRPPGMGAELERAGLEPLADWLVRAVPEAILAGGEIRPRPFFVPPGEPVARGLARWLGRRR